MKNVLLSFLAVAISILMMPGSAEGHHGWAAFDSTVEITLKGTVTDFHMFNPHSVVEFEVKDDKGQVRKWQGELSSPSRLVPRGWTATTLEAGDQIMITGWPGKKGAPAMWVTKIVMSDGRELTLGGGN